MFPYPDKAKEGRANPKGISYIYLNDDKKTFISETRPWLYQFVSLAEFRAKKNLKLVNFIFHDKPGVIGSGAIRYEIDDRVWKDISTCFSFPIVNNEFEADYAPTQFIAEFIKKIGYDGIIYKSLLGKGNNICIFNSENIQHVQLELFEIEKINLKIRLI